MDVLTQGLVDAIGNSMGAGLFPPCVPPTQEKIDEAKSYYACMIPVFIEYARENPQLLSASAVSTPDAAMLYLIDKLVEAGAENLDGLEEDASEEEIEEFKAPLALYYNVMVPPFINYIRSYPGLFQPVTEYNPERTPELVSVIANTIAANMFPPAMPASAGDITCLTQYYNIIAAPFVQYIRANPGILSAV